jgi:uncharacterized protein YjbI with pentapeptide repeats
MTISALTTLQIQTWIAIAGVLTTAILGLLKYFNFRSRRESLNAVGQAFATVVDALASPDAAKRFSGAVLLRRFFDPRTEHGERRAPYAPEAVAVIAALLRETEAGNFQKLLADGLGFAPSLANADLQRCNLQNAYLGNRAGREVNLSSADFFEADLTRASLKGVLAREAVFYRATLCHTVFDGSDLSAADFRKANLDGARFTGAVLSEARFEDAQNVPDEVSALLENGRVPPFRRAP